MASFTLKFDTGNLERALQQLGNRAPSAVARALNRSAVSTRVVMARAIAQDTKLKVGTVREQVAIQEAKPAAAQLVARISVSGKRIPLIDFQARGPYPSRGRGRGVTARLPTGKGRYPNAFIAQMKSGHKGVFQRARKSRLPIYELFGPSLPKVFIKYVALGLARGEESLQKNLAHEVRYALKQVA